MVNSTNQGMRQPYDLLFCSVELTESSHTPLICIVVINILLAVTAFVGNLLILVALGKNCPLHPPSKSLLRSLAASDLCVGILAEPTFIAYWLSVVTLVICYFPYVAVAFITSTVSRMSPALFLAEQITLTFIFLNSPLNPILHCWKINEIRNSVKETLTKLYHFSN
ncbi:olfactory receptor 4D1-like [Montipora foliosa]|uniref:olfactory receptor 4D1-like n=1 Tax=Montipora foliosa TaxID=591990 RepID=UPI0035F1930A